MKRLYKKIIVIMLCFFIVFGRVAEAEASGAEGVVQVVGGSIAAGGIAAGVAAIAPPALIIVGLIMIGQGIDIALTEASQAEGMTKTEFLQSKFEDFCDYTKKDFERTCNTIVSGAKILADGTIWLADEAGGVISQFIENLLATDEIVNVSNLGKTMMVNGISCPVLSYGESAYTKIESGVNYAYLNKGNYDVVLFACNDSPSTPQIYAVKNVDGRFKYCTIMNNSVGSENSIPAQSWNNVYYFLYTNADSYSNLVLPVVGTRIEALNSLSNSWSVSNGTLEDDSFITDSDTINTSILNPSSGSDIVIDTGIDLQGISSRYGDVGTIAIDDYLDTLRQAINGLNDLTVAVQNVATGVIENVDVGVYSPTDVAVTNESEQDAENQIATPVIDVNNFPSGSEAQEALQGLKFDLTNIFPFCIPFDVVKIIKKFDVTPVAPQVHISVPLAGLGKEFELDIDLSGFNTVAAVFRSMELVAFVVGLAVITRNLIRG